MLKNPQPRPYTRTKPPAGPKLTDTYKRRIDEILRDDEAAPPKQRHTATAIFHRLREEGYLGGYDQVRRYVAKHRRRDRETFLPLSHQPGQRVEADFGHIYADFPEGRRPSARAAGDVGWSNRTFAIAMPSEKVEAILHGTVEAFRYFDCVPKELWWDNPKTVAKAILKGRERELNENYLALASHYNFEPLFCLPARGNEKPHVEGRVKYMQRNWATPVPKVRDLDELNAHLRRCCDRDQQRVVSGQSETIGSRFAQEQASALPLPKRDFDAAITESRKVDKYQTVAWEKNRYSVPRRYAFATVTVKAYVDWIVIIADGQPIARHERSYGSREQILDPLHYLAMLTRKPACLDHTDVYRQWKLPADFTWLRDHLETRHGRFAGARQFIRVLQLLGEHPIDRVGRAIAKCRRDQVVTAERVIHRCELLASSATATTMTANCDDTTKPIPTTQVPLPDLSRYDHLFTNHVSQGGESDDQARPASAVENEPQATAAANDARRTREAGPRGGVEQSGLSGLLTAADRVGVGHAGIQCLAGSHSPGRLSGTEGPRYV